MNAELAARFRDRFFAALKLRITRLDLLVATSASGVTAALEELAMGFHSLSGIGGTYGYPRVTEIARAAEEEAWTLVQNGSPANEQNLQPLRGAVESLREFAADYEGCTT